MPSESIHPRVAAMLTAYESRVIDAQDLYARLLKALRGSDPQRDEALEELLSAVDEATDLGHDEREEIAWAAARYWRRVSGS